MKTTRIVTVAVLMAASVCVLHLLRAEPAVSAPANENQKEQSNMTNEKVIMLIEAKIQPQHRAELVEAARQYLPLVRAEQGGKGFTSRREKTIPIHLFSTRFTSHKPRRISTFSRTSLRDSWRF